MIILTSNKDKIREINELAPHIKTEKGPDLKEVLGNKDEVIIYKTLQTFPGYIVEDTILEIDGEEVVDIKWKLNDLKDGTEVKWIVSLGYFFSDSVIKIYRGEICGTVIKPDVIPENSFGFDPYFIPNGNTKTLHELRLCGEKDKYSPRKLALTNLIIDNPTLIKEVKDIPPWTGKYQNE